MSTTNVAAMITVTIWSPQGKNMNKISVDPSAGWPGLKNILRSEGYNIDSMKAIEGITNRSLEADVAVLPTTDFDLHLFPVKTKSGALRRNEAYTKIKTIIATGNTKAKDFFNKDKNYTNKGTDELNTLISKWESKNGVVDSPLPVVDKKAKVSKVKATAISAVVDTVANAKSQEVVLTNFDRLAIATSLLLEITGHENQELINSAVVSLRKAATPKSTKSEEEILKEKNSLLRKGLSGIA